MSSVPSDPHGHELLVVPDSLKKQLASFRSRVWSTKMLESVVIGAVAVLLSFLTVYCIDRFVDTPTTIRVVIFCVALAAWLAVPYALHRWVWSNRRFEQLARLLRVREPAVGDQLLSVIELADNEDEQNRSRTLCAAAIAQVAESAKGRDLTEAAPQTQLKPLGMVLGACTALAVGLAVVFPDAASNAWARFATPWKETPRYTFTNILPIEDTLVVPHGEVTPFSIGLTDDSKWQPEQANLQFAGLPAMSSDLSEDYYYFEIPPQVAPAKMQMTVGDYYQTISVDPKLRPELIQAQAKISLPAYLERKEPLTLDVRSGTLTAVRGSEAVVSAQASRELKVAHINEAGVPIESDSFQTVALALGEEDQKLTMEWKDHFGLAGREPFVLNVKPVDDEFPTVVTQDLARQAVVLDSEQLNFMGFAADDFGIKRIGIEWKGLDDRLMEPAQGEKVIAAGGPENTSMQVPATFNAKSLGIEAQPIELRLWVEDYMPERDRVYSAPHVLFVLTPEQHAIWITNQLSKWHRSALDVRDKEMQLNAKNKQLHAMTPEELADEEMRDELRRQASLEAANGRRLSSLARAGEDLLRQASRNPEIGVGHLDRWAEMLQVLNDIGTNRMPSVSDLLGAASQQEQMNRAQKQAKPSKGGSPSSSQKKPSAPQAGPQRQTPAGKPGAGEHPDQKELPEAAVVPKVNDMESRQQPFEEEEEGEEQKPIKKKGNGSRQGLATTTLTGPGKKGEKPKPSPEQEEEDEDEPFEKALFEQEELLKEFERIADELNTILANLEGSTLVKRLKAASREQDQVAEKIGTRISGMFGMSRVKQDEDKELLKTLSGVEEESSQKISYIMDDMQSYFERRRMNQFKLVLEEMKEVDVLAALRDLGEDIPKEQGLSIAQAEFWSDNLDRWAEDLVDPACSGQCPGCKTSDSLPPSIILEVLKILESEVNLREETRVAEQAKAAQDIGQHDQEASRLAKVQDEIRVRVDDVVFAIEQLPDGDKRFAKEIKLLSKVSVVMEDARGILFEGDTGSPAIAAETEAIELLLQCKRINPKGGGGGGGASPGGGGKGDTQDSALALLGSGLNQNERREARDVGQATGEKSRVLPEEFRAGLDKYFEAIEQGL